MISRALAEKVRDLLKNQNLSQRRVAKLTGVSRATVRAIASGEWFDRYDARQGHENTTHPTTRCPGCGALVEMPCRACGVRRLKTEGHLRPLNVAVAGPPQIELTGPYYARYLEVRAAALARGEPDADPNWSPESLNDDPWEDSEELAGAVSWQPGGWRESDLSSQNAPPDYPPPASCQLSSNVNHRRAA